MLTTVEAFDEAALNNLITATIVLGSDLKAGLYTNAIAPAKTLTLGALTEPTYGGYARQSVVMAPVMRDPVNDIASLSESLTWQMDGTVVPTIVQGIFYTFGAGPALAGIEPLEAPIALNDALDAFSTILEYIQSSANQGFTTVVR